MDLIRTFALLATLSVTTLAACQITPRDELVPSCLHNPNVVSWNRPIRMNTVGLTDPSFRRRGLPFRRRANLIAVRDTGSRPTSTGTMEVWASFRNCTNETVELDVRAHFFSIELFPIEQSSEWRQLYLAANSVGSFKELSTDRDRVAHYYIEVREAR